MIYAMSDIHGFLDIFQENLKWINLPGENRLMLLRDYIDYGPESGQTLRHVYDLQQRYGRKKMIVLWGNHPLIVLSDANFEILPTSKTVSTFMVQSYNTDTAKKENASHPRPVCRILGSVLAMI